MEDLLGLELNDDLHGSDIPIRNIWYMLLYVWKENPIQWASYPLAVESAPSIDGLLCSILANLMRQRMIIGLGRDYLVEEKAIRGIRGKINFGESLKNNLFQRGQAKCMFQEYSPNVLKNQIIKTTLLRMIKIGQFGTDRQYANTLIQNMRQLVQIMDGVEQVDLSSSKIGRLNLGRNDRDYRLMLNICELLIRRRMPLERVGETRLPIVDQEKLILYSIFEVFVANFYQVHLSDWKVKPQTQLSWHADDAHAFLPIMKPDLILTHKGSSKVIILDTKFTSQTEKNQYVQIKPSLPNVLIHKITGALI